MQPKTILITGAVRGIGRDTAFALAQKGHQVIATTRTSEQATALQREAADKGLQLQTEKLDITSAEDVARVATYDIDILINNAATGESGPMAEIPLERVARNLEVNVLGTLRLTQAVTARMLTRSAKEKGRIIILSSVAGRIMLPYLGPYSITKYALEGMGDALRRELLPLGIPVVLIEPGLIFTGFNEEVGETKYTWLKSDSPFTRDLAGMRRHDARLPEKSHTTVSVVDAICQAVENRHPKARYIRPKSYAFSLFLAQLAPTWLLDRILRRIAKN